MRGSIMWLVWIALSQEHRMNSESLKLVLFLAVTFAIIATTIIAEAAPRLSPP